MMNNNEMFKLANKFGRRVRFTANDECFEFWTDGLEKFAEAYHLAKCANNAPIGYVREWEGDVSDANNFIFVEKLDEIDAEPVAWMYKRRDGVMTVTLNASFACIVHNDGFEVTKLYAAPKLSEICEQLKIAVEALQGLISSVEGYRKNIQDNQPCDAEVFAKQALEKIGEL